MFKRVNLEVSMKVFKKTDREYIKNVVNCIYDHWSAMLKNREAISVLLWVSDGSNILDYTGNLDEEIEWNYFMGCAKMESLKEDEDRDVNLHEKNVVYLKELPVVTHRTIKDIVEAVKVEGYKRYPDTEITVGIPFDIGPEFARSKFKYERHPEICTGSGEGVNTFVNSYGELAADTYSYAGFPNGIPEGTPFGTFLGRQTNIYLRDMGMDYLWLSNGVGFSATSWSPVGEVFDGRQFHTDKFEEVENKVFSFWQNFRKECPDYLVYTRGTNFSAGIDYVKDAVGLHKIYNAGLNIVPPPNSPWAALNENYGLELMGHMTRNCELPGENYMFRYYLHDCWWVNSPWYDRYGGKPQDIYLPMALSRIDESGKAQPADVFNIFTLDNTYGNMPDLCVQEALPHFMKAEKDCADEAAPFVWVYPFREYTTALNEKELVEILSGDLFICRAISNGFPLSCVVSCDNFLKHGREVYNRSVLVTPVPTADSDFEKAILEYVEDGGKVLFYGSLDKASDTFMKMFKLQKLEGVTGEIHVDSRYNPDKNRNGEMPDRVIIREGVCNGMLDSVPADAGGIVACPDALHVMQNDYAISAGKYVLTASCKNAVWYRAPLSLQSLDYDTRERKYIDNPSTCIWGEVLLRKVLEQFGYAISYSKVSSDSKLPVMMINRSDNAEFFNVYAPDLTVDTQLKFPLGAPILIGYDVELKGGAALYRFPKAEHAECRVYVEQDGGMVSVKERPSVSAKFRRRIQVAGLQNATVRLFGESYCKENVTVGVDILENWCDCPGIFGKDFEGGLVKDEQYGTYYEVRNFTGNLVFSMPVENSENM